MDQVLPFKPYSEWSEDMPSLVSSHWRDLGKLLLDNKVLNTFFNHNVGNALNSFELGGSNDEQLQIPEFLTPQSNVKPFNSIFPLPKNLYAKWKSGIPV
jgi:hypothetical protein